MIFRLQLHGAGNAPAGEGAHGIGCAVLDRAHSVADVEASGVVEDIACLIGDRSGGGAHQSAVCLGDGDTGGW